MSFVYFLKLLLKNLKWLLFIPACLAASIWYFTRHEIKVYTSETVIYTGIASGYSLSGNSKVDFFTANNAFDNLISMINSRETKKEVCLLLLAEHLSMQQHDATKLSWESFARLKQLLPDALYKEVVKSTPGGTYKALNEYMNKTEGNAIYKIINAFDPFYSIAALDKIKAVRVNASDLVKISYESNDAAICKHTLELVLDVFMRKHRVLKEGQSESVVAYFEEQTRKAYERLDSAEAEFLSFNKTNDIINYPEQTKAVAGEKERLYAQNHNIEMDRNAAGTSFQKVTENLEGRKYQTLYGNDVLHDREELSDIYSQIAVAETMGRSEGSTAPQRQLDSLKAAAAVVERSLQGSLSKLYEKSNTPNGIPTKEVLGEWLQTMLAYEQSKARLTIMDKRKKEFEVEYKKFAPLGAMLKKIERKINVSEQEYLEMLHDLSVARLTQQNNELTTKLNVVDAPYLPLTPNPSKRMVLVIVGFMAGFIIVLIVILARALVNKTLQQPRRAARAIGLPLLGVYPLQSEKEPYLTKARLRILQHFLPHLSSPGEPMYVGFISVQEGEGKSTLADMFAAELAKLNYTVMTHAWNGALPVRGETDADIVLVEFPPLDGLLLRPGLIPQLPYTVLVCRANRIWSKIDKELLRMFIKTTNNAPAFILNGVSVDFTEDVIGEVPKKRLAARTVIKRLAKFEFGNRKSLQRKRRRRKAKQNMFKN